MQLFGRSLLSFCFILAAAKGELDLAVVKKEDGRETSVFSSLEGNAGAKFSLDCRVVDLKTGNVTNDQTAWQRKFETTKLTELPGLTALKTIMLGPSVAFISLSAEDQGQYICSSLEHNLRKLITVSISPKKTLRLQNSYRKRKRSNEPNRLRETSSPIDGNLQLDVVSDSADNNDRKKEENVNYSQWDVKKVKLHEENETQATFVRYHDGTTDIFRIGLSVSFALLAMIGIYRIYKCWRTGTLGPVDHRRRGMSTTTNTQNSCPDTCESNQTTITTCGGPNENRSWAVSFNSEESIADIQHANKLFR